MDCYLFFDPSHRSPATLLGLVDTHHARAAAIADTQAGFLAITSNGDPDTAVEAAITRAGAPPSARLALVQELPRYRPCMVPPKRVIALVRCALDPAALGRASEQLRQQLGDDAVGAAVVTGHPNVTGLIEATGADRGTVQAALAAALAGDGPTFWVEAQRGFGPAPQQPM